MVMKDTMPEDSEKPGASTYHALLVEYATGALDEACSLIVATHLALSPQGRKIVQDYETVGGSILNKCCKPVAMKKDALQSVMAKIDAEEKDGPKEKTSEAIPQNGCSDYNALPSCVKEYLCKSCKGLPWKEDREGLHKMKVKTCCSRSKASLWKFGPDITIQDYVPTTREIRLVLRGRYHHESGVYEKGELFILEELQTYSARSDSEHGCLCLVVNRAKGKSLWQRLKGSLCGKSKAPKEA